MRNKRRQLGVTLMEMTVVVTIAALMIGLAVPTVNILLNSFESESGAKSIISASLASARAIAAKEQRYAGIRFQKRYDPNNPDPLNESQYIIFIISDPNIGPGAPGNLGCRAAEGIQPIKLPDAIGVMDSNAASDLAVDSYLKLSSNTTFTILFSPSGKLIEHRLWVRNRNNGNNGSMDDVFNTTTNVNNNIGILIQDETTAYIEQSRNSFMVYDTNKLKQVDQNLRWTNYLSQLKRIYINPYTGTIINEK